MKGNTLIRERRTGDRKLNRPPVRGESGESQRRSAVLERLGRTMGSAVFGGDGGKTDERRKTKVKPSLSPARHISHQNRFNSPAYKEGAKRKYSCCIAAVAKLISAYLEYLLLRVTEKTPNRHSQPPLALNRLCAWIALHSRA